MAKEIVEECVSLAALKEVFLNKDEIMENKGATSVRSIANRVSGKVATWVGSDLKNEKHNVVIVDFYEICSMVPAVIHLNK